MPWSNPAPHPTVICLLKVDWRRREEIPSLPRNKGRFTYQWIFWHTSQAMSASFVPLAVSPRRALGCMPPAHPCHSWLQYAKPARRTSWKRQFLQGRVGFSPKLCTLCGKSQAQGKREVVPCHGLSTTEQQHCREDPCSCPLAMCTVPGNSHSLSNDTAQQVHIVVWRKEYLPDPTSFYIPVSWPMCIPWAPGATRIWPGWQAASLQACVIPSSSMPLQQCHNHCCKVQGGPLETKEGALTLSLCAQLLEKTWRYFQLFGSEFNAWKGLSQLCSMVASCPKEWEDASWLL